MDAGGKSELQQMGDELARKAAVLSPWQSKMTEEICGSMHWHVTTTIVVVPVCSRYSSGVSDLHMTLTRFYVGQKFTCLSH